MGPELAHLSPAVRHARHAKPAGRRAPGGGAVSVAGAVETALIVVGLGVLFWLLPHDLRGDDFTRLNDINQLLDHRRLTNSRFSLWMPLASVPVLMLGHLIGSRDYWAEHVNTIFVALGVLASYLMLRRTMDLRLFRLTVLALLFASFLTNRLRDYNAEVFTAELVTLGIIGLATGRRAVLSWAAIVIGVANTPAAIVGLGLLAIVQAVRTRRLRHLLAVLAAAALIMGEAWLRRGDPLMTGYAGNHGIRTIMPYSGLPGFSYPLILGLAAILFSTGRGLLFFMPGLLLWLDPRRRRRLPGGRAARGALALMMAFLAGLVLVYAKWWAWYGGLSWGPRFFLFAAVPAALLIAAGIRRAGRSARADALTLGVLALSAWVGFAGAITDLHVALSACSAGNYQHEQFCWFFPADSSLWQPIRQFPHLPPSVWVVAAYICGVFCYLAAPLVASLLRRIGWQRSWVLGWHL